MTVFFILGSNPSLSTAEILSVLPTDSFDILQVGPKVLVLEVSDDLELPGLMAKLGGTIKIGRIVAKDIELSTEVLSELMAKTAAERSSGGRATFGYSLYSVSMSSPTKTAIRLKRCGMETKRRLKESGLAARWVRPTEGTALTSVSVAKNGLTGDDGTEFVMLTSGRGDRGMVGITSVVQPFEEFSELDYGRPGRDTFRGMLPPKLARIMLNLASVTSCSTVWDPFCGSGTVLTEALQLDVTAIYGSDLSPQAIVDARRNVEWLKDKHPSLDISKVKLFVADASMQTREIPNRTVSAVVTEPFLGRPRDGYEDRQELNRRLNELTDLYAKSMMASKSILTNNASLVLALPIYLDRNHNLMGVDLAEIAGHDYHFKPLLNEELTISLGGQPGPNGGLVYGRSGQLVWREIVRLRRK